MTEWRPIESAPKDGTHILLLVPDYDYDEEPKRPLTRVIEGWWGDDPFWANTENWEVATLPSHGCDCCSTSNQTPTHWMPLPEKPQ